MTAKDLRVIVNGIAPVLRDVLARRDAKIAALEARLAALEAKPTLADEGVWTEGRTSTAGSAVTRGGGLWVARVTTAARPGDAGDDGRTWTLAVKRGHA